MLPYLSFGTWLRHRRKELDLTRPELAQCAGCSVSALRKIEDDERRPSKQMAELLADCLGIPFEELPQFVAAARGATTPGKLPATSLFTPPRSATPADTRPELPTPAGALVGRDAELGTLAQLLADPECRLVTLVGPGGIGKTRLAVEAASRQTGAFSDGIFFVAFAGVSSPTFIVPTIATALDLVVQGPVEPGRQLVNFLRNKQMLVVLDNLEHILDGVAVFAEILDRAPGVKLLATSRERLHLQKEWVLSVEGLPTPPTAYVTDVGEYSAVALFVQSARRARVGFQPVTEDWPAIARICHLVDGMPLGIELAAAWVSTMRCEEIAAEIARGLDFLATSARDVPPRQRSLRAAFEHSWNLLTSDERRVLSQVALFRGGFQREAAEHVAGATLRQLSDLVLKSLVRRNEQARYDLHPIVQQYSQSHCANDAQIENEARDRHSDFFLELLRNREKAVKGAGQQQAIRELTDEIDNIRMAWTWAVQHERFSRLGHALRCYGLLCDIIGLRGEGIEHLAQVILALEAGSGAMRQDAVLGQALGEQGMLFFRLGSYDRAATAFEKSLVLLRPLGDSDLMSDAVVFYAVVLCLSGELNRADVLVEEILTYSRTTADPWAEAHGLFARGTISYLSGHYATAYEEKHAGLDLYREIGDLRFTAMAANFTVLTLLKLGLFEEADALLDESLALCAQVNDRWGTGTACSHRGLVRLAEGQTEEAVCLLERSEEIFVELDSRWDLTRSRIFLGDAALATGDYALAYRRFLGVLPLALEVRAMPLVFDVLIGIAQCLLHEREAKRAAELVAFAVSQPTCTPEVQERALPVMTIAMAELEPSIASEIRSRVSQVSLEELVGQFLG